MLNMIMELGRITADPELKMTPEGREYVKFSIAVQRPKTDKNSDPGADFFNCTAWKTTARLITEWYSKGDLILVQGTLRNNHFTDKNGVKHYSEQIMVNQVHFTNSKRAADSNGSSAADNNNDVLLSADALKEFEDMMTEDSVPF